MALLPEMTPKDSWFTWRELRDAIDALADEQLDSVALVALDDMVWMMDFGGTAGAYPINGFSIDRNNAHVWIDDGSDEVFGEEG